MAFSLIIPSVSSAGIELKNIRHTSKDGVTRIVLDMSGPAEYSKNILSNPSRLCIDLKDGMLGNGLQRSVELKGGAVQSVRLGQYNAETARVVLELASYKEHKIFALKNPDRLVIDVYAEGAPEVSEPDAKDPLTPVMKLQTVKNEFKIYTVVIDPGHGGKDPGAIGPKGLQEKYVTLDIAKRLKSAIEKDPNYKVYLTRYDDRYLTLPERTKIANDKKADLFVSVHANANPKRSASGIETYILNWTDDEEAQSVAARENAISLKEMKESRSAEDKILASLQLQMNRDEALKLAHYVQGGVVGGLRPIYKDIDDNGVKQALFYVLISAEMPSVLVESSYVSNYTEEARLRTPTYRQRIADGIAEGVKKYFSKLSPVYQQVAGVI